MNRTIDPRPRRPFIGRPWRACACAFAGISFLGASLAEEPKSPPPADPAPVVDASASSGEDLAKKLANPISSLISVPFQVNYDEGFGIDGEGRVWKTNIQPVIPISLNADWNLISRTILPVIDQKNAPAPGVDEFGLGDTTQSLFFSPVHPTAGGWIWGAGPVFLLPTATDEVLGTEKWGMGPTVVILKQEGPWTYGALLNHVWSVAGEDGRADVNSTFIQPFVSYITKSKTTFTVNSESTFDWESDSWSAPFNFTVSQLLNFGKQPVQIGGGVRYWADSPDLGAEGWGFRAQVTLLFPK